MHIFQHRKGLPESGRVNRDTWEALVEPMQRAVDVTVRAGSGLDSAVHAVAMAHLREHPIELGGDNRGPRVRLYTGGNDGSGWLRCASFVSFVVAQAAALTGTAMPIKGSPSCDTLAAQARERGRFVPGTALSNGNSAWPDLGRCSIFLVRRTSTDWTHTGLAFDGEADTFSTIEGNTNDDGSRNGYEVCRRMRSVSRKDFIVLA